VAGDFNGDGIEDINVASAGCTGFCVSFAPAGNGTFRVPLASPNAEGNSVAVGDSTATAYPTWRSAINSSSNSATRGGCRCYWVTATEPSRPAGRTSSLARASSRW
jgi:hypothetical protein